MARFAHIMTAIDTHAAGEPNRIVLSGLPVIPGCTTAAKKQYMAERLDHFRTLLMQEPRGHRDMFGTILTSPTAAGCDYGLLFMDASGYLDMCGHGTMSVTTALIAMGMVPPTEPETVLVFDTPAGIVKSHARVKGQQVIEVSITNVPSFLYARDVVLHLPTIGEVTIDIAFGGNFFALIPAKALGVTVHPSQWSHLLHLGMLVKRAVNATLCVHHPTLPHITTVELSEIYEHAEPARAFSRSAVIYGEGHMDRSPCGTGTSAALATLHAKGVLSLDQEWIHESIIGTRFRGKLLGTTQVGEVGAVIPLVTGTAYITGLQQFVVDPDDPVKYGFRVD